MTTCDDPDARRSTHVRGEAELLHDQLAGIHAWTAARRAAKLAEEATLTLGRSREAGLDLSRRADVLRREHEALVERTAQHLRASRELAAATAAARAVIAHRSEWFRTRLADELRTGGIDVVAIVENGADAVGLVAAEQPDLLFVEERLPMLNGVDVLREVSLFAPRTVAAAQVEVDSGIAAVLEAGARSAFTRRVPPAEVALELRRLVSA